MEPKPTSTDSNFVNFNVSDEDRTFMSLVEGDRIEITANTKVSLILMMIKILAVSLIMIRIGISSD